MKRKVIVLAVCFLSLGNLYGQSVLREEAQKVVENFFSYYLSRLSPICMVDEVYGGETLCLYNVRRVDGSWCIVSADKRLPPILAYGFNSNNSDNDKPEALLDIIEWYKECVDSLARKRMGNISENSEWGLLINQTKSIIPYTNGDSLLDRVRNKKLSWGQEYNNSGTCSPSYNQLCPDEDAWICPFPYTGECNCGRKPVGCGAVAMGQLMWYWRWPRQSSFRTYYWEVMPPALYDYSNGTTSIEAENVTRMLSDCGEAADMNYCCGGAFAWWDNIRYAMGNEFGYNSASLRMYVDWAAYGSAWEDLIKSEIKNSRPVLFYGDSGFPITGHYFIVDGYQEFGNGLLYHVNWGHRGKYNCFCRLSRLYYEDNHGEKYYFNCNNKAIVGISPTYNDRTIKSLHYYEVPAKNYMSEFASDTIILPAEGHGLFVEAESHYLLESGHEIILCPGFEAEYGSEFEARINEEWSNNMDIYLKDYPPYEIEVNEDYKIKVENADSWEFTLYDSSGTNVILRAAGVILGEEITVWNSSVVSGKYFCNVVLKNSYGRSRTYFFSLMVLPQGSRMQKGKSMDIYRQSGLDIPIHRGLPRQTAARTPREETSLSPNPAGERVEVVAKGKVTEVVLMDMQGRRVGSGTGPLVDVSALAAGAYIVRVTVLKADDTSEVSYHKLVVQ